MHFPVTVSFFGTQILLHTICEVAGIFIGFRYFLWLRKKQGDIIETSSRTWILIAATLGAFIGSRLVGGFENPLQMVQSQNIFFYFYANKTVLGGFLGGLFMVELIKKITGENKASGDLFVYPLILALIIGRIGCFSMGIYEETYGIATTLPWGMNLGDGIARHPVALYEIIFLTALWISVFSAEKKWRFKNGSRFKIFLMSYILFRFLLDFIKPHFTFSFGLSTIQIVCITGFVWYARYFVQPKKLLA